MRLRRSLGVCLGAVLMVTGCGGGEGATSGKPTGRQSPPPSESAPPGPARFDPPHRFVAEGKKMAEGGDYAIAGDSVVTVLDPSLWSGEGEQSGSVVKIRVRGFDGRVRTEFRTPYATAHEANGPLAEYTLGGPVSVEMPNDRYVILLAGARVNEGSGTQRDQYDYVIRAHDAATGKRIWERVIPVPDASEGVYHQFVGVNARYAVLETVSTTYVLNTADGEVVWQSDEVVPAALSSSTLIGYEESENSLGARPVGISVKDGESQWEGPGVDYPNHAFADEISVLRQHAIVLTAHQSGKVSSVYETYLIDPASGKVSLTLDGEWTCEAGSDRIICGGNGKLAAFDSGNFDELWALPNENREAPDLHAVHNGVVYVSSSNGLMTLDARSGKDLDRNLGLSDGEIVDVQPGYALVEWDPPMEKSSLYAHRATK